MLPSIVFSQDEDLSISDVQVVKSFKAQLAKAEQLSNTPVLPDIDLPAPNYTYTLNIDPLEIEYPDPIIRPLAIKPDARIDPKMFWLKAGFGNLKRPEIDLGYNLFIEDLYNISFWGSYEGGVNDLPRSYSTLDLNLDGNLKLNDALEVNGGIFFNSDKRNLFNSDTINFVELDLNRSFTQTGFNGGVANNALIKDKIAYGIDLEMQLNTLKQYDSKRELVLSIPAHASVNLSDNNLFTIHNRFESSSSDIYTNGVSNDLRAAFKTNIKQFSADLGVNFLSSNNETHLFPIARLSYALQKINIYLGSDQTSTRNNITGLYALNPYVLDSIISNDLSVEKSIFIGSQGTLAKLSYEGRVAYNIYDNLVDFNYSGSLDQRFFTPQYYDGNSISIDANASYELSSWMNTGIEVEKLFYNLDVPNIGLLDVNLPDLEGAVFYRIYNQEKWQIKTTLHYRRWAVNNISNTLEGPVQLNNLVDLSIHGDYFFQKNAGVYLTLNNIANQNYERWLNYPDFGFNIYGGIKLKF